MLLPLQRTFLLRFFFRFFFPLLSNFLCLFSCPPSPTAIVVLVRLTRSRHPILCRLTPLGLEDDIQLRGVLSGWSGDEERGSSAFPTWPSPVLRWSLRPSPVPNGWISQPLESATVRCNQFSTVAGNAPFTSFICVQQSIILVFNIKSFFFFSGWH